MTKDTDALREQLANALADHNEPRFKTIAFVHRHEILAALATPASDVAPLMVPRNPSDEMVGAGLYHMPDGVGYGDVFTAWQAMFDAIATDGGCTTQLPAHPPASDVDTIGSHFGNGGGFDGVAGDVAPVGPVIGTGQGVIPDTALDAILADESTPDDDAAFTIAWLQLEARGYCWSESNVKKAHLGWQLARALYAHPPAHPVDPVADVRQWMHFAIEMPVNADGNGPATIGKDAVRMTYEVWDQLYLSHGSFDYLPDAINEAMRLNGFPVDPVAGGEALREALEALLLARSWVQHAPGCSIHTTIATEDGFREECNCQLIDQYKVIDDALAALKGPAA